jgi:hypothetical protein
MLALGSLFGKVICKGFVPFADVFGCIVQSISEIL